MKTSFLRLTLFCLLALAPVCAQEFNPPPFQDGPWRHRVLLATSPDGVTWTVEKTSLVEQASVPELYLSPDGRPILVFVDAREDRHRLSALERAADGSWQPATTNLREVDPNVVRLEDGTYRAYVKSGRQGSMAAFGSKDGLTWESIGEVFKDEKYPHVTDPDVFQTPEGWVMLISNGPRLVRCTSADGLKFTAEDELDLGGSVSDTVKVDGGWRTFFHGMGGERKGLTIRSAFTSDGKTWKTEAGDRVSPPEDGPARLGVGDPAPVKLADGTWLMALKSFMQAPNFARNQPPQQQPFGPPNPPFFQPGPGPMPQGAIRVQESGATYEAAKPVEAGAFKTGQPAALVLGAKGFNDAGGPLLFNHPTGLATDGKNLLVVDRWNNRILIWKTAPEGNTPPDLVLGQKDFTGNNSGAGLDELNWPGNAAVSPDGKLLAVADTNNHRLLLWTTFPTANAAAANLSLSLPAFSKEREGEGNRRLGWPWGIWTDGTRLAAIATHGGAILIWNKIPTQNDQAPDLILRPRDMATPRNITSDGTFFAVSDHNHGPANRPGTAVWRTFPTAEDQEPDFTWNEWMKGTFTADQSLVMAGMRTVFVWKKPPVDEQADADVILRLPNYRNGDGPDVVQAGGRLYVCNYNGNNVLAWHKTPDVDHQEPDFSLGSTNPWQDTWAENFFLTNPVVATDGKSLVASSDFDRKLFVWRQMPGENGARPDLVYTLPDGPWDNALHGQRLVLAGKQTVYVWNKLPLQGELPDAILRGRIGRIEVREITGVALDDRYFYLADRQRGVIDVWDGIPSPEDDPVFTLPMERPGRLSSDGIWLAAAPFDGQAIQLWKVADLKAGAEPARIGHGRFNLPGKALVAEGRLFVADTSFNRVQVWDKVEDAIAGNDPTALLGVPDAATQSSALAPDRLFMPGSLAYDGASLWVGEFKFSSRILRFSPCTE